MAQVIVRNIEVEVKTVLKQRAAQHGWSMEEEVRQILRNAVSLAEPPQIKLGSRIAKRFAGSPNARTYWSVLKNRLKKEGSELATKCSQPKMNSADGKTT
jgi:plasmid stability protein